MNVESFKQKVKLIGKLSQGAEGGCWSREHVPGSQILVMAIIKNESEKTSKQTNTRFAVFVWKRRFFLRFGLLSTRIRWKRVTRNASFQKRSPVWRCLTVLLYSYGRIKQRLLKTITSRSWIPPLQLHVDGQNQFKNATCGRGFFGKGRKNLQVQTKPDT